MSGLQDAALLQILLLAQHVSGTTMPIIRSYQEQDGSAILLLVAKGHHYCIKCTTADIRLRTPDDGQKGCPKHVES